MKFHPAFDEALAGILEQDGKATIVLLASGTQIVWMEQLRRRFRQRFGRVRRHGYYHFTLGVAHGSFCYFVYTEPSASIVLANSTLCRVSSIGDTR